MLRASLLFAAIAGCGFSPPASAISTDAGSTSADASDACTAGQTTCDGRDVRTCGSDGTWDPSHDHVCDFTCASGACVVPSNVVLPVVTACGSGAPALDPGPTGTVTYDNGGGAELTCSPACGGYATLAPVLKANNVAWFCVSAIDLQPGARLQLPAVGSPADALGFIVDGTAMIAGTIALDGGAAGNGAAGGTAAPGGFAGAAKADGPGGTGAGSGGGAGGSQRDCDGTNWIGGGGGGGGSVEAGGSGGSGECQNADTTVGGDGGRVAFSTHLVPLVGGAGGGGGGDATSGGGFGWAGGGGGGALQISARLSIAVDGVISARGGTGYGVAGTIDGGGGGGAGGGVLLESPSIAIGGSVLVDGGDGGPSGAGAGGAGATGMQGPQPGLSFNATKQGGSGGGGGGGIVQLRSVAPVCGSGISPASACVAGMLTLQPSVDRLSAAP